MASMAEQLVELVERIVQTHLASMFGMLPGTVVAYDQANQLVDVQPEPAGRDEDGNEAAHPVINGVPLRWPRGHGGAALTFPLQQGDRVMLLPASASLDRWLQDGTASAPDEDRRGDLSDVVAVAGLYPRSDVLGAGAFDASATVLSEPAGGQVWLGKGGGPGVARTGDATASGSLTFVAVAAAPGPGIVITLTYVPPGGGPPVVQTVAIGGAVTTPVVPPVPASITGQITGGSATVKAKG